MTSADVGGEASLVAALVGVPLIVGLGFVTEAVDDVAGLGDGEAGALIVMAGGAGPAPARALGWLTSAEQPASDTTPSSAQRRVPRRYPTGAGYGRSVAQPGLSTG